MIRTTAILSKLEPSIPLLESVSRAANAGAQMALAALKKILSWCACTLFACQIPVSDLSPTSMFALMVVTKLIKNPSDSYTTSRSSSHSAIQECSIWLTISDFLCSCYQALFVPLRTLAVFPRNTAHIAKLSAT